MKPKVISKATEIEGDRRCTACGRPLKGKVAWLELDQRYNLYHDLGGVPPDKSQGWFPFGLACAKHELKKRMA